MLGTQLTNMASQRPCAGLSLMRPSFDDHTPFADKNRTALNTPQHAGVMCFDYFRHSAPPPDEGGWFLSQFPQLICIDLPF